MKGLKRQILDFEIIPTGNLKTLVFIDSSEYFSEPERPLLEVTLPGYSKYFLLNIAARKVNTFNSNTIGLTELLNDSELIDLPDGAYSFRFKICPYDKAYIDKKFFRTTYIETKLADLFEKIEGEDCSKKEDRELQGYITEILVLLEGAKAVVNNNEKKANKFYQIADSLINKLLNDICKTCS